MQLKEEQALELEQRALNKKFVEFQEKHKVSLIELTESICERCGETCKNDLDKSCHLLMGLTWHIFSMYFNATTGAN